MWGQTVPGLLLQLRELVTSTGTMKGPDGADMKRPKHVVLSDTINLLKNLKERVGGTLFANKACHWVHGRD